MMEKPSMVLENIENTLFQAAQGYKGTDNIENQLMQEAITKGLADDEAKAVVSKVLKRLKGTETGKKGNALGVAHNPVKQKNMLAVKIAEMRF
jgi:hypothetical protein